MKIIIFLSLFLFNLNIYANVKVGISQFVSHPSLEKVRKGIIEGLEKAGFVEGENLTINYKNANGNIVLSSQIAKQFASQNLDVAIGITTPSSQTLKSALKGKVPLVFSTVTDPISAGLISKAGKSSNNITGVTNPLMLEEQVNYMLRIIPEIKKVGVLVNYSEDNSVKLLQRLRGVLNNKGVTLYESSVNNSSEVSSAIKAVVPEVDALFLLQDNTVASAVNVINKVAINARVPTFSSYIEAVEKGSLAGLAYDEYNIGFKTGLMAAKVIRNKSTAGIKVERPTDVIKLINIKIAGLLKLKISNKILNQATIIQ